MSALICFASSSNFAIIASLCLSTSLLVKNKEEKSGKILDAEKLNIKIENIDDFKY